MLKRFPVLLSVIILLSMLSFVVAAETSEPESFSFEESSSLAVETSSPSVSETSSETSSESSSEVSSGFSDDQEAILNRLDLIYTLGLFVVAVFAALLVIFILWRVLDVFI